MGDVDAGRDVGDRQQRISRTLQPDEFGPRGESSFEGVEVGRIDERRRQARAVYDLVQQSVGAAVDVGAGDDMIAGFEKHGGAVRGGHAGSEGQGPATSLERSKRGLESLARGIAAARVIELAPLAGNVLHERAGDVDRRDDGPGRSVRLLADMHGTSTKSPVCVRIRHGGPRRAEVDRKVCDGEKSATPIAGMCGSNSGSAIVTRRVVAENGDHARHS